MELVSLPKHDASAPATNGNGKHGSGPGPSGPRLGPAELTRRTALLEAAPVFAAASDGELRALARRLRPLDLPKGATVVARGERSTCVYLISSGKCRLDFDGADGRPVPVATLRSVDFFGEVAFFSNGPSPFSAVAATDVSLLVLDRSTFHGTFGPDGEVAIDLRRLARQRATAFGEMALRGTPEGTGSRGTLVAVYSPKGGTGRTTIALNLCAQLAVTYTHQVLLLDLSYPFNHAALMSNLVPTGCLARAGQLPPAEFEAAITNAILRHPKGVHVLPTVLKNEEIEMVRPELVERTLELLRNAYRYLVVDMSTGLNDAALTVLDQSDQVLIVVTPELAAAKAAADVLEIFAALDMPDQKLTVLLNNRTAKPALIRAAVERVLKHEIKFEIGYQGTRPDEVALKESFLVLDESRGDMARVTKNVVKLLETRHPVVAGAGVA